jgi:hypothetical protein
MLNESPTLSTTVICPTTASIHYLAYITERLFHWLRAGLLCSNTS